MVRTSYLIRSESSTVVRYVAIYYPFDPPQNVPRAKTPF
jgi:hypothetical protein